MIFFRHLQCDVSLNIYVPSLPSPAVKIFSLSNICWRNAGTEPSRFLSVKLPSGTPPTPRPLCWLLPTVGSTFPRILSHTYLFNLVVYMTFYHLYLHVVVYAYNELYSMLNQWDHSVCPVPMSTILFLQGLHWKVLYGALWFWLWVLQWSPPRESFNKI